MREEFRPESGVQQSPRWCVVKYVLRRWVPRNAFPPTPPGPEGSNGNGLLRVQRAPRCLFLFCALGTIVAEFTETWIEQTGSREDLRAGNLRPAATSDQRRS